MHDIAIKGLGFSVPERVLTNADLERLVDTSDEWITSRTGIKKRHIVENDEPLSTFAVDAARQALDEAGMAPEELTHILVATFSADALIPSCAALVQHKLGLKGLVAMDLSAACTGFLYALETARAIIALHPQAKVLLCSGDIVTSRVNWNDRTTCVLFGDGCGAAVVTADNGDHVVARVRDILLGSDGGLGDLLTVRGGGSGAVYRHGETIRDDFFVEFKGREVFKHAVRHMCEVSHQVLERAGLGVADVDVLLPHQANFRIIDAVGKKLELPAERVYVNVDRYGNTSAASVPIALTEAWRERFVKPGERLLITAFGGGFTWGAGLLEF
jgi:3-oxoacyl-[acyl-carrier-protein] synthase-3